MKKFLLSAAFVAAASALHAGTINYSAFVGACGATCTLDVQSLTWIEETVVSFALVQAGSDTFTPTLFPAAVGGIVPSSQAFTVSSFDANIMTNGVVFLPVSESPSISPKPNGGSVIKLEDANHNLIDEVTFLATAAPAGVPEPAAWALTFTGMVLVFLSIRRRRRNSLT